MKLEPCPWCHSKMDVLKDYAWDEEQYFGYCITCKFETGKFSNKENCIKYINQRPVEDKLQAKIKELNKLYAKLYDDHLVKINKALKAHAKDIVKLEALKQWQREAVPLLVGYQETLGNLIDMCDNSADVILLITELGTLIKQAVEE